jgi:hypothetical protein
MSESTHHLVGITVCDLGPASAPSGGYRLTDLGL